MSSEPPLVSIVIDNYNYARFLGAAIESALAQSYERCEVIVVDDGSTDDSADVIRRYPAVQSIFKANGGQASAFNSGFEVCKGDFVVFLDADDLLHPEASRWAVDAFLTGLEVAKVQFRMKVVDGDGRPTGAVVPPKHVRMPTGDVRPFLARGNYSWWTPTSGQVWRASALRRLFPLPEPDLRIGADHFLQPTVAMLGHVVSLEQPGALYRLHGTNDTLRTELDLPHLRQLLQRSRAMHAHVVPFARANGMASYPADFADTEDIILLAVRMTSLRLEPGAHPVPDKGLIGVMRLGVAASLTRPDVTLIPRIANALWFVAMLVLPRRVAARLARTLFYPASRGRWEPVVRVVTASRLRLGARRRRGDPEHVGVA